MYGVIIFLHVIACVVLISIILMQSGRGGGLTEAFSSAESIFGAKTNEFLIKATTVFAVIFLVTSVSLALISTNKNKSIMSDSVRKNVTTSSKTEGENSVKPQTVSSDSPTTKDTETKE